MAPTHLHHKPTMSLKYHGKPVLDDTLYPEIIDCIRHYTSYDAQLAFRATSRVQRDKVDAALFHHVVLVRTAPQAKGDARGVAFALPANPRRLLPYVPWTSDQLRMNAVTEDDGGLPPGEEDPKWATWSAMVHVASNQRMLSHIRVLDVLEPFRDDCSIFPPLEVVRFCGVQSCWGPTSRTLVQSVSLNSSDKWQEAAHFRSLLETRTVPLTEIIEYFNFGVHTFTVFLTYDIWLAPLDVSVSTAFDFNPTGLKHVNVVLPVVPLSCDHCMEKVVNVAWTVLRVFLEWIDLRYSEKLSLTIVGVERFGPRHFGVEEDAVDVQQATLEAVLADVDATSGNGADCLRRRVSCISWEEWSKTQALPQLKEAPPFIEPHNFPARR